MNIDEAELTSLSPDSTLFVFNPCFQIIFFFRFKLRATASCVFVVHKTVFSFDNQVTNLLLRDESPQNESFQQSYVDSVQFSRRFGAKAPHCGARAHYALSAIWSTGAKGATQWRKYVFAPLCSVRSAQRRHISVSHFPPCGTKALGPSVQILIFGAKAPIVWGKGVRESFFNTVLGSSNSSNPSSLIFLVFTFLKHFNPS